MTTFGGDGGKSGISRYIMGLLEGFAALEEALDIDVFVYDDEVETFLGDASPFRPRRFGRRIASPVVNIAWHGAVLPFQLMGRGYDLAFLPAGNRRLPLWSPIPTVGVVHDFSCLHMEKKYDGFRETYIRKVLPALVRRLDGVITISESSKKDIVDFAGVPADRIELTPLGVDHRAYRPRDAAEIDAMRRRLAIEGPYLVYVSRIEHPGKNHVRLIEAFDRIRASVDGPLSLVLAGSDWNGAEAVHRAAESARFARDIRFTGFAAEADMPLLYSGAEAMIFPSLYEGFGLPVLEAMACGTAVAYADVSSLPEVAGDAALPFDPENGDSLSRVLLRLLGDEALRADLSRRGLARAETFEWTRTARQTLACFRRVLERCHPVLETADHGGLQ